MRWSKPSASTAASTASWIEATAPEWPRAKAIRSWFASSTAATRARRFATARSSKLITFPMARKVTRIWLRSDGENGASKPAVAAQERRIGAADRRLEAALQPQGRAAAAAQGASHRAARHPPGAVGAAPLQPTELGDGVRQAHQDKGRAAVGMKAQIMVLRL